jgi:hypothetical protein
MAGAIRSASTELMRPSEPSCAMILRSANYNGTSAFDLRGKPASRPEDGRTSLRHSEDANAGNVAGRYWLRYEHSQNRETARTSATSDLFLQSVFTRPRPNWDIGRIRLFVRRIPQLEFLSAAVRDCPSACAARPQPIKMAVAIAEAGRMTRVAAAIPEVAARKKPAAPICRTGRGERL